MSDVPPIDVVAGRYRIARRLGRGGMGSVWQAEHLTLHSPVAIKLIDPSIAQSDEARARFLREAQSAALLRSPHVVQILDHGIDQTIPYIVMEMLEGESLATRLERQKRLPWPEVAHILTHVARAMSRAHAAGIVHRDLKPENIFLVRNDDEELAKVLDFGIAKTGASSFDVTTTTRTGSMLGTPYYMSPEQVEGSKQLDHRSDLWSLAVIAFECMTGARPFENASLGGLIMQICTKPIPAPSSIADVPPGFDAWFAHATQREPEQRFQSAKDLAESLREVLEGRGQVEPQLRIISSIPSRVPGVQRRPWGLMGLGILIAVGGAGYWLMRDATPANVVAPAAPVVVPAESAAQAPAAVEPPAAQAAPEPAPVQPPTPDPAPPSAAAVETPPKAAVHPPPRAAALRRRTARVEAAPSAPAQPSAPPPAPAPARPSKPDLGF
ncbi:MAG TPA: serine/threonine-protein kinase [Polyangiales bacterium]|nr:serine/threonine-protein kinase [Polyangiales bacterium]